MSLQAIINAQIMNQQDFENAFIAKLSGIVEYKNENEIWWEINGIQVTIEFLNDSVSAVTTRRYYENSNKSVEINWQNGEAHGKTITWYEEGNKCWEANYRNGKLYGKYIYWYKGGIKHWEYNYQNDELHGRFISWNIDGSKREERDYQNGELKEK